MSYATYSDVLFPFPRFQVGLPNNLSAAAIQAWLDEGKAVIRARFLRRNLDPDNPSTLGWDPPLTQLTTDQTNILRRFNKSYAIVEFGSAAYSQLNEGELKLVGTYKSIWDSMSKDTDGASSKYILGSDGVFDAIFTPTAAHVQVTPQFSGIAGSEYDPRLINNRNTGSFYMFEKGMRF